MIDKALVREVKQNAPITVAQLKEKHQDRLQDMAVCACDVGRERRNCFEERHFIDIFHFISYVLCFLLQVPGPFFSY